MAAMTAAYDLTDPSFGQRFDVTVYQMGWRLGGKGASGRGVAGRIEEHGLHLWMGYYENAFRMMRGCYAELGRDPTRCPIATFEHAFSPANFNAVTDWSPSNRWLTWNVHFPATRGLPGDPDPVRWSVRDYLTRAAALAATLLQTLSSRGPADRPPSGVTASDLGAEALSERIRQTLRYGALTGLAALTEATHLLQAAIRFAPTGGPALEELADAVLSASKRQLQALTRADDSLRRLWEVVDLILAAIRGSIRFGLLYDERGFDAIDDYDSREWLLMNGASRESVDSAFMRALYDLAFAYRDGDPNQPAIAAGSAMRGAMRAFFTYRGGFFWRMHAGMGDVVFAPLYEVLRRRGVRFEFFNRVEQLDMEWPEVGDPYVAGIDIAVQADIKDGLAYDPLVDVHGVPSWPAEPRWEQLVGGDEAGARGLDWESPWEGPVVRRKKLQVSTDFDFVVLGVGLGAIPDLCGQILERDRRWQTMTQEVRSIPTQAFQLWLGPPMSEFGWMDGQVNVSGFVEPFDTWADMTHLVAREDWARPPGAIAYFCNVLPECQPHPRGEGAAFYRAQRGRVRDNAIRFMDQEIQHLWPNAKAPDGRFRWDLLLDATGASQDESRRGAGSHPIDTQFWTANVKPSERYSQALPGTTKYRISPLDRTYSNLTVAGDWTKCGINMGCVEAAAMSGRLAAHAISGTPALEDIVGFDHP